MKRISVLDDAQTLLDTQIVSDADDFTLPGPLSIAARLIV